MRLLQLNADGEFSLAGYMTGDVPPYAILSHTWGEDGDEVIFNDLKENKGKEKTGYAKIRFCANQAGNDGLEYIWVDTCCINKQDPTELSEAITSMFRWYRKATKCYVYLQDVSSATHMEDGQPQGTWESAFRKSRWFTRGWTLQELLAPASVEFFSREGNNLGDKKLLERQIHDITGIPIEALRGSPLSTFAVDKRMSWAAKRQTKRVEDKAYCLLGIFGVYMPLMYGEGTNAFKRLKHEIKEVQKRNSQAGASWQARHGMTSSEYQDTFNELANEGYQVTYISAYTIDDDPRFAAIWERNATSQRVTKHSMTSDEYQDQFNTLVANGFRLNLINGYTVAGEARYAAIWDKSTGTEWATRHDMTSSDYRAALETYSLQGYRLRHVSGYARGNQALYAALWDMSGRDVPWVTAHSLTTNAFQGCFDQYLAQGFRLVHTSGYVVNNVDYYAGIWDKSPCTGWAAKLGMSSLEYQYEADNKASFGYRMVYVSGYTLNSSEDTYAALWTKDQNLPRTGEIAKNSKNNGNSPESDLFGLRDGMQNNGANEERDMLCSQIFDPGTLAKTTNSTKAAAPGPTPAPAALDSERLARVEALLARVEAALVTVEQRAEKAEKRTEALEEFIRNEVFPRINAR